MEGSSNDVGDFEATEGAGHGENPPVRADKPAWNVGPHGRVKELIIDRVLKDLIRSRI